MSTPRDSFDAEDLQDIEFVDEAERVYFAEAKLGHDIWAWLRSPPGRYLHGRAKIEKDECAAALLDLDYTDPDALQTAQQLKLKAAAAANFMKWCVEAMSNGQTAEVTLETYRSQE